MNKTWLRASLLVLLLCNALSSLYALTDITPAVAQNRSRNISAKFQVHIEPNTYSISYPQTWFVTRERKELTYITNKKIPKIGGGGFPDDLVKTDVEIISESFQKQLNLLTSSAREDGEKLVKRENIKVNGKSAVRLWFTGGETEAIITILPYKENQTAYIASFYTISNPKSIPIIETIHSSFKILKSKS